MNMHPKSEKIPAWAMPVCVKCGSWKGMWHNENCPDRPHEGINPGQGYGAEPVMEIEPKEG